MKKQVFTVDTEDNNEVESAMEKLLFIYKINEGLRDEKEGKIISHENLLKSFQ
jgi:hypothetical protein